uniref:Retrovirus-related Pol polyprotein from transposon TNT 1-94 n=1 Tax=Nicotiana tabacum TaxID=4097 RepID=A0A1S4AHL5_TOBAC|nr:PREDICTED: uncharacterized protein LOC107797775 [Nicotiana tabacum]
MWSKRHNAGMIESDKVYQLLMGLNESYTASRGNILMMTPLPSLSETYSLLVHEEKKREIQASVSFITAVAFLIAGSNNMQQQPQTQNQGFNHNQNRNMNFRNGNNGGKFNIDFKVGQKFVGDGRKNTMFFNYYKKSGHLIDRCYKLHGYPTNNQPQNRFNNNQKAKRTAAMVQTSENDEGTGSESGQSTVCGGAITKEQMSQLMQLLQNVLVGSQGSSLPEGIGSANLAGKVTDLDSIALHNSGATDHMTSNLFLLSEINPLPAPYLVVVPNGYRVKVHSVGSLPLSKTLSLPNVLHVPSFQYNLVSIHKLCKQIKGLVCFSESTCFLLRGPSLKRPLEIGSEADGLYILQLERFLSDGFIPLTPSVPLNKCVPSSNCNVSKNCENIFESKPVNSILNDNHTLWHYRLGHLPYNKLKSISSKLSISVPSTQQFPCHICPLARQTRNSFPSSSTTTTCLFALIHVDVWGPYNTITHSGNRYFLTLVDDYSRSTWTYLLSTKSNAFTTLKDFIVMVETQFSYRVKTVRSDNALELRFSHESSSSFFSLKESFIKHLVYKCLNIMELLKENIDTYLKLQEHIFFNPKFPNSVLQGKTPHELLFGTPPSYDHLRAFGCLCYISTLKRGREKFSSRASPYVFLGYPFGKKGYRVLNLATQQIVMSRDVVFHEAVFSFALQQISSSSEFFASPPPPPPPPDLSSFCPSPESSSLTMPTGSLSLPTGSPPPPSSSSSNVPPLTPTHVSTPSTTSPSIPPVVPLRKSSRAHQ